MQIDRNTLWLRRASIPIALIALMVFVAPAMGAHQKPGTGGGGGSGGGKGGKKDITAPVVAILSPAPSATVSDTVQVDGSASDNVGVASVTLTVDGGSPVRASGATSWTDAIDTTVLADGAHTITAQAVDAAGNTGIAQITVDVANASTGAVDTTPPTITVDTPQDGAGVSGSVVASGSAKDDTRVTLVQGRIDSDAWSDANGTTAWTIALDTSRLTDGGHIVSVRALDAAGNVGVVSVSVQVSNSPSPQGSGNHLVTPEGVTIDIDSAAGWTAQEIYGLLRQSALDLQRIGPTLTIRVQDTTASQTLTSVAGSAGSYTSFKAVMYLKGVSSTFALQLEAQIAHEYGHVWSLYHLYIDHGGDWSSYLRARWSTADGSLTLATDPRLGSSYTWDKREIIAEDYRLLLGSAKAISERPSHMNTSIPEPSNVDGLATFLADW